MLPRTRAMLSDPATTPALPTACPSCGAAVRSRLSWCSLCFATLEPVSSTTGAAAMAPVKDPVDPLTAPPTAADPAGLAELDAVADRLLGQLAAQQGRRPGARLPEGRAARAGLIVAAGVGGCALLVGVLAVLGLFI